VLTGYAALYRLFLDLEVTIHHQIAEFDEVVTRKPYRATHRGTFLDTAATGRVVELNVSGILKLRMDSTSSTGYEPSRSCRARITAHLASSSKPIPNIAHAVQNSVILAAFRDSSA
jgi:hypothetical protein